VVFEDFILQRLIVVLLKAVDHGLLLPPSLHVLEVVHVELVLKIVNVGVLLDVDGIEAFKFGLEALVLLLVLGLDILDTLETLVHPLELLPTALNLVQ